MVPEGGTDHYLNLSRRHGGIVMEEKERNENENRMTDGRETVGDRLLY